MAGADLYELFAAEDELTAEEQAKALAEALRQRESAANMGGALGKLGLLTGDRVLGQFAQAALGGQRTELGAVDEGRALLGQAGKGRLERTMRARELAAQRALRGEERAVDKQFQAEQKELDRQIRADELRERAKDRAAMFGARMEERQSSADEKALKELAEDADKIGGAGFYQREAAARRIMEENPKDLPGYGRVAGRLPDELVGAKGVELRQAVGQMLSEYRKGQTGAGMSDAERSEYGRITGLLQAGEESAVRQGIDQLRRAMDARISARAGGSPRVAEEYAKSQPWFRSVLERQRASEGPAAREAKRQAPRAPIETTGQGGSFSLDSSGDLSPAEEQRLAELEAKAKARARGDK